MQILTLVVLMWACLPRLAIKPFVHFLQRFFLMLAIETFNVRKNMIFKCVSLVEILMLHVFMWASHPCPAIRSFVHILVCFLLMLAIENLNVNDNTIHKVCQVSANIIIGALMWTCLPHPEIRTFVHYIVRFLLKLAIETFNVNDNMVFKCVRLVQILPLVALMWTCLPRPAKRTFGHF